MMERMERVRLGLASVIAAALVGSAGIAAAEGRSDGVSSRSGVEAAPPPAVLDLLTGTVRAVEEGPLGRAEAVEIVTDEIGNYPVEDEGAGKELKEHVGKTVTVVAVIRQTGEVMPIEPRLVANLHPALRRLSGYSRRR